MTEFEFFTKTKTMHICRGRECNKMSLQLEFKNRPLPHVDVYKYLGVQVDNNLSWRKHIEQLKKSCIKTVNLLKMLIGRKWRAEKTTLIRLYLALVTPKLDYGSEAYWGCL